MRSLGLTPAPTPPTTILHYPTTILHHQTPILTQSFALYQRTMTDPLAILRASFPGHRSPVGPAADWMDIDKSTIYRWIKDPRSMPQYARLLFTYLDLMGPLDSGD